MARILKVGQSDYRVCVQQSGNIILDTGNNVGLVTITGDLVVNGEMTTINTTNLAVEDNIITLNTGEDPDHFGITLTVSGFEIERGSALNAQFLFDESIEHYDFASASRIPGTFSCRLEDGSISNLQLSGMTIDPNVNFAFDMQDTTKTLRIVGSSDYSSLVVNDNDIPNKKFINDYVSAGLIVPGMADVDRIYFADNGIEKSRVQATNIEGVIFAIDGVNEATLTSNGFTVHHGPGLGGINIFNNVITNYSDTLTLRATTNFVEVDAVLKLDHQSVFDNTPAVGVSKIYSRGSLTALNQTPGNTGIFISNAVTSDSVNWNPDSSSYITGKDELVSKNRALLFSMIF